MAKEGNSSLSHRAVFLSGQPRSLQLAGQHTVEGYHCCLHSRGKVLLAVFLSLSLHCRGTGSEDRAPSSRLLVFQLYHSETRHYDVELLRTVRVWWSAVFRNHTDHFLNQWIVFFLLTGYIYHKKTNTIYRNANLKVVPSVKNQKQAPKKGKLLKTPVKQVNDIKM